MPYIGRDLNQGNYLKLDDISSQFDGSKVSFDLKTGGTNFFPGSSMALMVVLGGVVQEAEAAYTIDQSSIEFASAPTSQDCFIIVLGSSIGVSVPADASVTIELAQVRLIIIKCWYSIRWYNDWYWCHFHKFSSVWIDCDCFLWYRNSQSRW